MTCNSSFESLKSIFKSFWLAKAWVIQITSLFLVLIETDTCSSYSSFTIGSTKWYWNITIFLSFFSIYLLKQSLMKTAFDLINWLEIQGIQYNVSPITKAPQRWHSMNKGIERTRAIIISWSANPKRIRKESKDKLKSDLSFGKIINQVKWL